MRTASPTACCPVSLVVPAGWYAPGKAVISTLRGKTDKKHCDGSEIDTMTELAMVRVDAPGVGGRHRLECEWRREQQSGVHTGHQLRRPQDASESGFGGLDASAPESGGGQAQRRWLLLHPAYYYAVGPLSLDVGRGDIGRGDIGRGDIGRGDIGRGDIGRGDIGIPIGRGDIGRGDIGRGDIGRGDIGRGDIGVPSAGRGDIGRGDIGRGAFGGGDTDVGGADEPFGDLDLETAIAASGSLPTDPPSSPANELTACLTSNGVCASQGGDVPVLLN